ncbi:MAG: putative DNA-binding domain-containing protein [Alphaproteobacteria bacterium]|nr:putative DNA-binding domain-containing protein [Alphaproteobacteria bacterium]
MMRLADLQLAFQAHILGRPGDLESWLGTGGKADAATLLAVYREGYGLRLAEILAHNHPKLALLLGAEDFAGAAGGFIAAHPSRQRNARWYGAEFADFLARTPPWSERPALAELARFEWLLGEAFDAADADPLDASAMAALPPASWGETAFRLHPSLRRLDLATDAAGLWQILEQGERPGPADWPAQGEARSWMIWRRQDDLLTYLRSIEADEATALDIAGNGGDFGAICEALARWHGAEAAPGRAAGILAQWFHDGLIVGLIRGG